jgi:hypothetical protein
VPIPDNPIGYTLVYVIESAAGPVLVDAGWDHPASWRALTGGLRAAWSDVSGVYGCCRSYVVHREHFPGEQRLVGAGFDRHECGERHECRRRVP